MKILATTASVLTCCVLATISLMAQDDQGGPPPPSPENGPYVAPDDQGAPPQPDQTGGADQAPPDQSASFQTFYDGLAPQGTWIQSSDYGYIWQPAINDPNWAPYTNGHWVYADVGWTWVSDEPWGWATYHYGRWVNLDGTGWCWVPGYTWAPAWVSWRYGAGYCGWAPLPPASFIGIDYAGNGIQVSAVFHIGGDCDSYYGIGAGCYHFVPVNYLGASNYRGYYANHHDNYTIINQTTNVTNLNVTRPGFGAGPGGYAHVTNGGPSYEQVNSVSSAPVPQVQLTRASQPGAGVLNNNSLALFAPHVTPVSGQGIQPPRVGRSLGQTTINRGVDINRPLTVNGNLAPPAPTPTQIQQARWAQSNAPANARVVTASTPVNPVLQAPIRTFQPISTATTTHPQGNPAFNAQHSNSWPVHLPDSTVSNRPNGASNNETADETPAAVNSQNHTFMQQHTTTNGSTVRSYVPLNSQPQSVTQTNQNQRQVQPVQSMPVVHTPPALAPQPQTQPQVAPAWSRSSNPEPSQPVQNPTFNNWNSNQRQSSNSQPASGGNGNGGNAWGNHGNNGQGWNNQQQQNH